MHCDWGCIVIGGLVKRRRNAKGLTQTELGRRTGLTQNYISKLETGVVDLPQRGTLDLLAGALDTPIGEFYRAAGVLEDVPGEGADPPAPRVVVVQGPEGPLEVPIGRVVEFVEALPNPRLRDRLGRWRATYDAATYERLCARLYTAWSSNAELMLDALDVADAR